jgi:hypothetical protein
MSRKLSRNSRRAVVASLLGLTVGGGVLASAASLGINTSTLGAGTTVIASCTGATNVTLKYGHTYSPVLPAVGAGSYRTSSVTVSNIAAACVGKAMDITLKDATGASLGSGNVTVPALVGAATTAVATVTFGTPADAVAVVGAAVVIAD